MPQSIYICTFKSSLTMKIGVDRVNQDILLFEFADTYFGGQLTVWSVMLIGVSPYGNRQNAIILSLANIHTIILVVTPSPQFLSLFILS